ncbi:MAG: serine/threonine protein kinase [Myxococcota bacterium]
MAEDSVDVELQFTGPQPVTSGYRLLVGLGGGGMGQVFLAESVGMAGFRKLVVIKQLRASLADQQDFLTMFLDEAKLAARLNHPNVVQTNEVGRDEAGNYFIAMEFLDGQPLNRIWRRRKERSEAALRFDLHVISQILKGLEYAHQLADFDGKPLRVVHRDVSPHNLFVTYDGAVKLIDFGIAKVVDSSVETQEGIYRGKIRFASPEQIAGDKLDARTDLYSLGVVLWEALAGRGLWDGVSNVDIARRVVMGELPDLEEAAPSAPAELKRICRKALERSREARYATAAQMREELEAFIAANGMAISERQVGETVAAAFAAERAEVSRRVEEQLKAANLPWLGRQSTAVTVPIVEQRSSSSSVAAGEPPVSHRVLFVSLGAALLVIGVLSGVLLRDAFRAESAPVRTEAPRVEGAPTPSAAAPVPAVIAPRPVPPTTLDQAPPPAPAPVASSEPEPVENEPADAARRPELVRKTRPARAKKKPEAPAATPAPAPEPPKRPAIDIIQDPTIEIVE